jgi:hypothetical protein
LNITEKQKQIYNCYLKHLRKGQPYNLRKNFDDLNGQTKIDLYKLQNFFNKFKQIRMDFFFEAFAFVYPNDDYPQLSFFCTRKALKCYSLYKEHKENQSPDTMLDDIKKSVVFIGSFCMRNNILMQKYLKHKTLCIPTWIKHYKEGNINIYAVIALGYSNELNSLQEDERELWVPNLLQNITSYKIRYSNCKSKVKIMKWLETTENFIKKNLTFVAD